MRQGRHQPARWLRHNCRKLGYQVTFWLIVAIYQYAAFGFLQRWELPVAIEPLGMEPLGSERHGWAYPRG